MNLNLDPKVENKEKPPEFNKPNETGGIQFSSSIKIFDPNTKEILVQKRGDD